MNKAILIGRLTADPELRKTESGISKCSFRLAIQEDFKKADGTRDVDFLNVVAWRSTADFIAKYFRKGSMIAVSGKNKCDIYEQDGETHYYYYIKADSVEFVGYNKSQTNAALPDMDFPAEFDEIVTDDELPI